MRTTSFAPPYPTDLGTWVAAFRHRVTNHRGHPSSPESIGKQIGVSGATVRRWESGRLKPGPEDAANLARACNLTSLQVAFLSRALRMGGPTPVPDLDTFCERATPILNSEFPTFIMDSLLYIRGWNSYLPRFLRRDDRQLRDYHYIDFVMDADQNEGIQPGRQERVKQAVLNLWYMTADACGTVEYRALIDRLSRYDIFREAWQALPFLTEGDCAEIGLPRRASRHDIGESLIAPFVVVLPPLYHVRQVIPMDADSRAVLEQIHDKAPCEPVFDRRCHWAQTEEDEAFVRVF